ncbi:MAG: Crp/Fnr family transcriptional regulator [Rhodospirillaceae bacterium]
MSGISGKAVAPKQGGANTNTGLGSCEVLKDLAPSELLALEAACQWLHLPANHLLFRHDDPPDAVYFIVSGKVRAFMPMHDGKEVTYALFGAGEMFGELAAIDGNSRTTDVITVTDSVIASCPRQVFLQFLREYPSFGLRLMIRLTNIIRQSDKRIAEISALTEIQRVYLELLRFSNPDPSGNGTWVIRPAPLHKDLAGWASVTTDMVGRAIGHLMKANLVQRRQGALYILDRKRVERMAREGTGEEL